MKPIVFAPLVAIVLAGAGVGAYFAIAGGGSGEEAAVAQATPTPTPEAQVAAPITPTPTPTPEPTPAPTADAPTATPTPSGVPADWQTYTDPVLALSLKYPPAWHLSPGKGAGELTALLSYDPASVPPEQAGMPVPRDKLKAEIVVLDNPEGLSLEAWIQRDRESGAPVSVSSRSAITVDNTNGIAETVEFGDGGSAVQHFFLKGTKVYVIVKYPSDSLLSSDFATILGSFRFTAVQ